MNAMALFKKYVGAHCVFVRVSIHSNRKQKLEDGKFEVSIEYTVSSSPARIIIKILLSQN